MGLPDPASESSAHHQQSLSSIPGGPSFDTSASSDSDSVPLAYQNNSSTPPNNSISPSSEPPQPSPTPVPDVSNSTPAATPIPVASPLSPLPSGTPINSPANVNSSTPTPKLPALASQSPSPSPVSTPVANAHVTTPTPTPTPTPVNSPKSGSNITTPPAAATPSHAASSEASINTITSTVEVNNAHPFATAHRNVPTSTPASQGDNSTGLSGGAITGIAVVAGIIGFILLFWVGVQLLQSKRRRREEAEMQEIDFYPSGGGSVNGGMAYPRATGSLDRQPSASNSFNYNKTHYTEPQFGEAIRDESEYIESTNQEFEPVLQRQATLGGSSAYSGGYYNNPVPPPPGPYTNYSPYSHQFGMQPPQAVYEQHAYEYPLARAPTGEYRQGHVQSNPPTGEYHHGPAPSIPPASIEYQR